MTSKAKYLGVQQTDRSRADPMSAIPQGKQTTPQRFFAEISQAVARTSGRKTLVRPQLEYVATVWDTFIRQTAVEAVQRRAARFIMGDYIDGRAALPLCFTSLQTRRLRARATMMYRAVNNLIQLPSIPLQLAHNISRGHSRRVNQPSCNIKCYQDSFYPVEISIWNALPLQRLIPSRRSKLELSITAAHESFVFIRFLTEPPTHRFAFLSVVRKGSAKKSPAQDWKKILILKSC